eukprot:TRINITY_DN2594_c0_g1_i1.p1 TRINITY_DN2594_c0_g1~~TRINITY_DN2594_c0_g1_i1.p1  ORF type:complete len:305 (+),score=98.53 TRINITY_DN2594_c0_g1_i1:158-1072(+)
MQYQTTARRRRAMKKKYMDDIAKFARSLVEKVCPEVDKKADQEEREMYYTLKDTFNAFDRDGNAEMGYPEYVESWKFLNQPGGDDVIKRAFDAVDVDGSGLLEWDEYVFSIMGEAALKYGLLADMETLSGGLESTLKEVTLLKEALEESAKASGVRADRNKNLRARLENMRGEVATQMNDMIANMMGINPEDVLSDEEINAHLKQAFNKFDKDSSGELGEWEFTQAWVFLGLKGSEDEIKESFKSVDTNKSGLIDLKEFQTAIKNDRLLELNLGQFLNKIGVNYQTNADAYAAFATAQKRRRIK